MTSITLPPLPEPGMRGPSGTGTYFDGYTADQLRADRLAVAQAVQEACAAACVAQASRFLTSQRDIYVAHECVAAIRAIQIEVNDANV
jgi:hypothetical protein